MKGPKLPTRVLGSTGRTVTIFGLGGEGVLRTHAMEEKADEVISAAHMRGLSYFDSAHAYAGSEAYYGRCWRLYPDIRERVFITSKSAARDKASAQRDLETTLVRMQVEEIDLWQIHDVRTESDLAQLTRRGGALEAFLAAKASGFARHIGVTGHHDPKVLLKAVRELPVETVLLPVNIAEGVLGGFMTEVIPEARRRKMGVIGMKVLGQGTLLDAGFSAPELLRYSLSQDIDTAILGCSTREEVYANADVAASFTPMSVAEIDALHARVRPRVRQLADYRGRF